MSASTLTPLIENCFEIAIREFEQQNGFSASDLKRIGFNGPMSVHCEFEISEEGPIAGAKREMAFLKKVRDAVVS